MSLLGERLKALESSKNHSLPRIRVILDNNQEPLDCIEAGAHLQPRTTRTREEQQQEINRNDEVYTDQSDEEATPTHERTKESQSGTSRTHGLQQNAASCYTRSRSHHVDRTTPRKYGYQSESSSEEDYLDKRCVIGHDNTNALLNIVQFHSRPTGTPHIGFTSIKHANNRFDKFMSCR